jgi:hypothetical protein
MAPIALDHVEKVYSGGVKALDDLKLEVKQGAAGGDRWLLTAVRGHLGDTHWARSYYVVQAVRDPASLHGTGTTSCFVVTQPGR